MWCDVMYDIWNMMYDARMFDRRYMLLNMLWYIKDELVKIFIKNIKRFKNEIFFIKFVEKNEATDKFLNKLWEVLVSDETILSPV